MAAICYSYDDCTINQSGFDGLTRILLDISSADRKIGVGSGFDIVSKSNFACAL